MVPRRRVCVVRRAARRGAFWTPSHEMVFDSVCSARYRSIVCDGLGSALAIRALMQPPPDCRVDP